MPAVHGPDKSIASFLVSMAKSGAVSEAPAISNAFNPSTSLAKVVLYGAPSARNRKRHLAFLAKKRQLFFVVNRARECNETFAKRLDFPVLECQRFIRDFRRFRFERRRNSIFDAVCYGCLFLRRTESGRPVASMRLRTAQPMAASAC